MIMRYIILLILFFSAYNTSFAQNRKATYTYDNTGNRIKRTVQIFIRNPDDSPIDDDLISNIHAFPNPTAGQVIINIADSMLEASAIKLFNLSGLVVYEQQITQATTTIDISSVAAGEYLLTWFRNDEIEKSLKIIKLNF